MKSLIALTTTALLAATIHAETVTLLHPDAAIPPGKTAVWSPLFQATWNAINVEAGGQPVRIDPPNDLMTQLDTSELDVKAVMPDGSWKVWAGPATKVFLDRVNREAREITKEATGPFHLEDGLPGEGGHPESLAAFGLLDREIEFQRPLYRSEKKSLDFITPDGPSASQFFGVAGSLSSQFGDSIRVLAYEPTTKSHAVELMSGTGKESVIFYRPPASGNFKSACASIRTLRSGFKEKPEAFGAINDPRFHAQDVLKVPYISLDVRESFPQLTTSTRYHGKGEKPWRIAWAEQLTRFDLHEKGARVRVKTSMGADPFGEPPPPPPMVPRFFIYDRPFFVFLWRDQAEWPYFGTWIGDSSALKSFP